MEAVKSATRAPPPYAREEQQGSLGGSEESFMEECAERVQSRSKRRCIESIPLPTAHEYSAPCSLLSQSRTTAAAATEESAPPRTSLKRSFTCSICSKSFSSFQALGGHKSSHTKAPFSPAAKSAAPSCVIRSHECSICHKIFPTGQSLGGHMRCHYNRCAIRSNSNGVPTICPGDFGFNHRTICGQREIIDLNLPVSPDEPWHDLEDGGDDSETWSQRVCENRISNEEEVDSSHPLESKKPSFILFF